MIQNFDLFCKLNFIKESEINKIRRAVVPPTLEEAAKLVCPNCGGRHTCSPINLSYDRYAIVIEHGKRKEYRISIPRVYCSACQRTSGIVPGTLIPDGSYSVSFVLWVLRAYFLRMQLTVEQLCQKYCISTSTIYEWLKLFRIHKALWLDAIEDRTIKPVVFIDRLIESDSFLVMFYKKFRLSFLRASSEVTTHSNPP